MANQASNRLKYLLASGSVNFSSDTFKIALMASGFVFNKDNHHGYADVSASELGTGNGYTAGGATLAGVTVTEDDTNDYTEVTWANQSWAASGGVIGPTPGAIIYDDTEAGKSIVGYIDFGANYTQAAGGNLVIGDIKVRIK